MFLYTDGLPEATNAAEEQFGTERMTKAIQQAQDLPPEEMLKNINASVSEFVNGSAQFDDLTMLGVHFKGKK